MNRANGILKDTAYTLECLADAESIVINFTTAEKYTAPVSLRAVSPQIA